jgi:DNA-binding transcriptional LysR family regulator
LRPAQIRLIIRAVCERATAEREPQVYLAVLKTMSVGIWSALATASAISQWVLNHRCIHWRWPGHVTPYAWEFFADGSWFEVAVDGPLIVNDREMTMRATLQGVGIGFRVEETVEDDIAASRLVPLLERWSAPFPGLFLWYPQQRQTAPALRAFIDAVRSPDLATTTQLLRSSGF